MLPRICDFIFSFPIARKSLKLSLSGKLNETEEIFSPRLLQLIIYVCFSDLRRVNMFFGIFLEAVGIKLLEDYIS